MRESGITEDIVIDAEDTDVVVLCAYAAHKLNGSLGLKRKGSIYDCKKLCTKEVADVILYMLTVEQMLFQVFLVKERRSYLIEYLNRMSIDLFFLLLDRRSQFPTGQLMI